MRGSRPTQHRVRGATRAGGLVERGNSIVHRWSSPFTVIDVETPAFPRSAVIASSRSIVRVAPDGSTEDEDTTLVNPLRDVGATYIHGITDEDVAEAPLLWRSRATSSNGYEARSWSRTTCASTMTSWPPSSRTPGSSCRPSGALHAPFACGFTLPLEPTVACGKAAGMHAAEPYGAR